MKRRFFYLIAPLVVFFCAAFSFARPLTAEAAPDYYYTNSSYVAIQGPNPFAVADQSETVTFRKVADASKWFGFGSGVYLALDSGRTDNSGGICYPAVQTSSKKYDGDTNGKLYLECGSRGHSEPNDPRSITISKDSEANPNANGSVNDDESGATTTQCESDGNPLNWILCPIYNTVANVGQWMLDKLITPLLYTNPLCLDNSGQDCNNTIFKVWSSFRLYGNIFLVIALLVIVFGESIGGGLIDAYTAKKILPRLLAAAVLINLSIYIVAVLIDITNVIGGGIGQLLTAPLQNRGAFEITPSGIAPSAVLGAGFLGLTAGGLALGFTGAALLLVGLAVTGAIALVGVFVTLIIRQTIIIGLVLVAPVAFALWCLPNTERWFRRWWDLLFQMLLVYPLIVAVFAIASILSAITVESRGGGNVLATVISFLLLVIPLYMIPFILRSSNRVLGAVQGAVGNVGQRINSVTGRRALGAAGAQAGKNWESIQAGNRFRGGTDFNRRGRLNRFLQGAALATPDNIGFNPRRMRDRLEAARSSRTSALSAEAEKSTAVRAIMGNDDLLAASLNGTGSEADARAYLQRLGQRGAELEQNVGSIRQARREMGFANFEDFAAANLAGTGTGYRGGPAEMFETINRVAGNDRARATRILNSARGQAERAKRIDLAGSGFATSADVLSQLYNNQISKEAANERVTDEVLDVQSAGVIGTARNNALKNMAGSIERRIAKARLAVENAPDEESRTEAQHAYKRVMANTASLIDVAGSASPENAEVIGALLGQHTETGNKLPERYEVNDKGERIPVGERDETYADQIEALRTDAEFQQYRREYGSARAAAAAEAGAQPSPPAPEQ